LKWILKEVILGADFETAFFGDLVDVRRYKADAQIMLMHEHQFFAAVKQVKAIQEDRFDWNPFRPKTAPGNLLFLAVIEHLPVSLGESLGMYTAVGTVLDHYGMDGFFMSKNILVGFDLTLNQDEVELEKKRAWAAHAFKIGRPIVIIEKRHLEKEGGLANYGKAIAKHLIDLFEKQKKEKALRRLKQMHGKQSYDHGEPEDAELVS
jgi:hypothetical protein